jgi:hypothetical protein
MIIGGVPAKCFAFSPFSPGQCPQKSPLKRCFIPPNATGSLLLTAPGTGLGTATITVTVDDGQGANNTVVRTFVVTVTK